MRIRMAALRVPARRRGLCALSALGLDCEELAYSLRHGELAEEYNDRPCPTRLVHGPTFADEPLHSEWAWNKESGWAACVSVRRPQTPSSADAEAGEKPE